MTPGAGFMSILAALHCLTFNRLDSLVNRRSLAEWGEGGGGGGGTQKSYYTWMLCPEIDYVSRALSFSLFSV